MLTDKGPSTLFCATCQHELCVDCSKVIHAPKLMASHNVVQLAEKAVLAAPSFCGVHRARPKDLYCIECKVRAATWLTLCA